MEKLGEKSKFLFGLANADITTDRTGVYSPVAGFRLLRGLLIANTVADTKVVTIELLQATDSSGTGSKALKAAVTFTSDGGETLIATVDALVEEMDIANGFNHVAVKVTSNNASAVIGCAALELGDPRHLPVVAS